MSHTSDAAPTENRIVESIAVYVCTHRRNEPLARLLRSLDVAAEAVQPAVEIAVVVVDDNPDGRAEAVVDGTEHRFIRGLHYRHSGAQNISKARNLGLEAGLDVADWVAMTDDDQVVVEGWLQALIDMVAKTGADAVTGPVVLRPPEGSPAWLTDQPWHEILEAEPVPDGTKVPVCSTGNSMVRGSFLRTHPDIRFRPDLGTLGGEDMMFYRAAVAAGLDARYANEALCYHELPPERLTYRYHLRTSFWMGNSQFLTNHEGGDGSRERLLVRGVAMLGRAVANPMQRVASGEPAHWRFAGAEVARALGMIAGVAGVKVTHR